MSSEIPALPNEAPEELSVAAESETIEEAAVEQEAEQREEASAETEEKTAPTAPSAPAVKPTPASLLQATPSAAPAMPAMPVAGDEDDDFEIPDEEEVERLIEAQEHGVSGQGPETPEGLVKGVVVSLRHDGAFVDVGEKSEAFLPYPTARGAEKPDWKPGDEVEVSVSGRSAEGYLQLTSLTAEKPGEFRQLEAAFAAGSTIVGKVLETVKGGLAVDVGARGFLPASRSGERDQASLEALVGHEIRCRIAQLDVDDRNVVLDRRSVVDEERSKKRQAAIAGLDVGSEVDGVVRNIRDFGAFVDLGGIDALLHVSDISWGRVDDVTSVLKEGQELRVKVLRIEKDGKRIAVGLKQLERDPWSQIADDFHTGDRVRGKVTRLKDFGAFVEILPGAEGLIHVSEMSWARRVRHPSDVLKVGDEVEAVILEMNISKHRIALGLKQALGDPWDRVEKECAVGAAVTGVVRKITNFGAFLEILDGVEGLLHVSDITSERRLNSPAEVLKIGDSIRVKVLELNRDKRRLKLGMKQLEPTDKDRYIESVQPGEVVTGRIVKVVGDSLEVELGEGVRVHCAAPKSDSSNGKGDASSAGGDVSSMTAMLQAAWSSGGTGSSAQVKSGELRSFKILSVDPESGAIEIEPA